MPLPDGTCTALEVSDQLNRLLTAFKPTHAPGSDMWDAMCAEYADALCRFPLASLKGGISKLISTRKDKFWPVPGEIAAACQEALPAPVRSANGQPNMYGITRAIREDAPRLVEEFERTNARLYAQAKDEGWLGALESAVGRAAHVLAQRDEQRRQNIDPEVPCRFPNILNERISIDLADVQRWRGYLGIDDARRHEAA